MNVVRWMTQLLSLTGDVKIGLSQMCAVLVHVKIGAGVHVTNNNTKPTRTTFTHNTQKKQTKTSAKSMASAKKTAPSTHYTT